MATIRIVDDDVEYSGKLAKMLEHAGYTVSAVDHTDGLADALIAEKTDLLILDVMFPDNPVAGFDAARAVHGRSETRHIPIILLTAVNQEFPMDFSARDIDPEWMPVQDFLEKPVAKAELLKKIARLLTPPPAKS